VFRIGVLPNVEILLNDPSRVGEESPLRADRRAKLLERVMVVGRNRRDLRIGYRIFG
jgi:hypothetical protein